MSFDDGWCLTSGILYRRLLNKIGKFYAIFCSLSCSMFLLMTQCSRNKFCIRFYINTSVLYNFTIYKNTSVIFPLFLFYLFVNIKTEINAHLYGNVMCSNFFSMNFTYTYIYNSVHFCGYTF